MHQNCSLVDERGLYEEKWDTWAEEWGFAAEPCKLKEKSSKEDQNYLIINCCLLDYKIFTANKFPIICF